MKALMILMNGLKHCTAGVEDGNVTVVATRANRFNQQDPKEVRLSLHVAGFDDNTEEHLRWSEVKLAVGDEITIKVVETEEIDPPVEREKAKLLRSQWDKNSR